jgi:hypothetical protein
MTIVACFSLKQAKPTIESKIWPNVSPKSFLEGKPKMPFSKHPKKHIKTLFPTNKNKVRKLLHQTILFESLFLLKRLRLKSQAVALKNMCDATKFWPVKISFNWAVFNLSRPKTTIQSNLKTPTVTNKFYQHIVE